MTPLELAEIQAYLLKDYKDMGCSKYYLLQVTNDDEAKKIIGSIADEITNAYSAIYDTCLNIGFTSQGLEALGMVKENMKSFSREFREGMYYTEHPEHPELSNHRQRLLGDFDSSDPKNWEWGGPKTDASSMATVSKDDIHVILMVFGKDETIADNYYSKLKERFNSGFKEVHVLKGNPLPNDREHFGFKDGISQPVIIGSGLKPAGNNNDINPGEFVLGYKNEYDIYPDTARIEYPQGEVDLLTDDAAGTPFKDLGRNGTYFVLRQLEQDVNGFWEFLKKQSTATDEKEKNEEATMLAAKMMGRWPGGAPLVKHDKDPGIDSDDNDFNYLKEDEFGEKCPFGAHIRRTNPRDLFEESPPKVSLKLNRRHRIIRRVRSYGENFIGTAENHTPNGKVGLYFGCFNANISKQFEFIQYTWANSPKFKRLYADPDPFIGVREHPPLGVEQNFTIPQPTVNRVIPNLQSFVTVKGGAYFFFPSVTVIKYLGTI